MRNSIVPSYFRRGAGRSLAATAVLTALLGFGTGSALAQDEPAPPPSTQQQQPGSQSGPGMGKHMGGRHMPSVDDQLKNLTEKLSLTDDQQAKLKPMLEDQRKQMEQIRNDSSLSRQDMFSKMQDLRQSSDTQIKSVLSEDQQKNFDQMRAEQRNRMKQWHKGGENAPPAGAAPDSQK